MDAEDSRSALRGLASQLSAPEFSSRARGTHVREAYAGGGVGMAAAGDSLARILDMMTRLSADLAANGGAAAGAEAAGAEAGALSGSPGALPGALPSAPPGALPGALPVLGAPPLSAAGAAEAATDEVLRAMMGEYERMGSKEDFGAAVDGVMRQLLTRELMYEPIRRLCESFPEWLASNAPSLVVEHYERCVGGGRGRRVRRRERGRAREGARDACRAVLRSPPSCSPPHLLPATDGSIRSCSSWRRRTRASPTTSRGSWSSCKTCRP